MTSPSNSLIQYLVFFEPADPMDVAYSPTVSMDELRRQAATGAGCLPYGLDMAIAPVIAALFFCLLLPRRKQDLATWIPTGIVDTHPLDLGHHILVFPLGLAPPRLITEFDGLTVSFAPDDRIEQADPIHRLTRHSLPLIAFSSLDQRWELVEEIWKLIGRALGHFDLDANHAFESWGFDADHASTIVSWWLYRWFTTNDTNASFAQVCTDNGALRFSHGMQAQGKAMHEFFVEQGHPLNEPIPEEISKRSWHTFRCPVSVVMPGLSAGCLEDLGDSAEPPHQDAAERCRVYQNSMMSWLGAHRAIARTGVYVELGDVSTEAFGLLQMLEQSFSGPRPPVGRKVDRLLGRLSQIVTSDLSDEQIFTLESASEITLFSEFPLGLVTVGSATAPLACSVPVAHRPLIPLTRAMQLELDPRGHQNFSDEIRVAIAEFVPESDLVGRLSRSAWSVVLRDSWNDRVKVRLHECTNLDHLQEAASPDDTDILIISAHGFYDRKSNRAGLQCGNTLLIDQDIGPLPPLTILSACHVWPMSGCAADVAGLLLRQGTMAVIGTLVPVDVRHNSRLVIRFLANIAHTLEGGYEYRSIQEVWQHTITTDAINCIVNSNPAFASWAHARPRESSVLVEFKMHRSQGRLRGPHMFADTEEVLLEIARDRDMEDKVKAWLSTGYVKESLFYAVLGWPERIRLSA